jgi:FkbM family methyltransferase
VPDPLDRAAHLVKRTRKALGDRDYRRAITARTVTRALHRLNPDVRYLVLNEDGALTFLHVSDSVITPWIIAKGHYQRDDFETAWAQCRRLAPRPEGGIFVDVGANVGTTTLYALRTGGFSRAVCMEPAPDNLTLLRLNVSENGLSDVVSVIDAACSDREGTADLLITSGNQGDHRLARDQSAPDTHELVLEVATVPLDRALESVDARPDDVSMVWVDTQGHEPGVLAGASGLIAAGAPFVIEFWPDQYRQAGTLDSLIALIQEQFTQYFDLHHPDRGAQPVGRISSLTEELGESTDQTDIILLRGGHG